MGLLWGSCLSNLCTIYLRSWKAESDKSISWRFFSLRALNATPGIRSYLWLLQRSSVMVGKSGMLYFSKMITHDDPHLLRARNETLGQSCWNSSTPCCRWTLKVVYVVRHQVRGVSRQASKTCRCFYLYISGLQYHLHSTDLQSTHHTVSNDRKAMDWISAHELSPAPSAHWMKQDFWRNTVWGQINKKYHTVCMYRNWTQFSDAALVIALPYLWLQT